MGLLKFGVPIKTDLWSNSKDYLLSLFHLNLLLRKETHILWIVCGLCHLWVNRLRLNFFNIFMHLHLNFFVFICRDSLDYCLIDRLLLVSQVDIGCSVSDLADILVLLLSDAAQRWASSSGLYKLLYPCKICVFTIDRDCWYIFCRVGTHLTNQCRKASIAALILCEHLVLFSLKSRCCSVVFTVVILHTCFYSIIAQY